MTFINQRTEYRKRRKILMEELELLKKQRRELTHNKSAEAQKIVAENVKLKVKRIFAKSNSS